jgi:gliding motility-associated lipoprotein GldH
LKTLLRTLFIVFLTSYIISSCTTADLYEKTSSIPGHSWQRSYKPSFTFTIKDTSVGYQVFLVIRHNDKYAFNNIWLNITVKTPGSDIVKSFKADRILATDEKGWLANGMDDIYEHRIDLNDKLVENNISFRKPGDYTFSLEQIMRENPLHNILNAGLRIEKKE